jgi:hypothetical protein
MDWLTQGFDNQRTGWNPAETTLTVANVPNLRLRFTVPVDGQIYAQPLYVSGLRFPDGRVLNVVYVATEGDSVYAFEADGPGPPLWHSRLVPAGETTVPWDDVQGEPNIAPQVGITSTPVIDRGAGTLFVVAKTKQPPASYHYRLHALDLLTGADKCGSPIEITGGASGTGSGQVPAGSGSIPFDPKRHLNRPGLLLDHGVVYVAFSSHADWTPYHGWVFAYAADTLALRGQFCTSPDTVPGQEGSLGDAGSGGGVWQAGFGPAADAAGSVYFLAGNGPFDADAGGRDYGDALVRLHLNGTFVATGYFFPPNRDWLNDNDLDFGSGGAMLLPPQPGVYSDLLVCCGKVGVIYLLHRADLRILQTLQAGRVTNTQGGIWGGPAYAAGPTGRFVYYAFADDHLKAFRLANGQLHLGTLGGAGFNQTAETFPDGGATPIISSNGGAAGTGVAWAIRRADPVTVYAYDATNLQDRLFSGIAGPWNNPNGPIGSVFIQPTVVDGRVLVGSSDQLAVFSL